MFVAHYPYPVVGGLERQAHELSKALMGRGHAVTVLSTRFAPSQPAMEVVEGVPVYRVAWFGSTLVRFLLLPISLSYHLFRLRCRVDVVHVHNISWIGACLSWLARALELPVLTKLPNIGDAGIPGMRRQPLGSFRIALLKQASAIVAMTPESLVELADINYPTCRILRVTNGIPLHTFPLAPTVHSTVKVVFTGRLTHQKGLTDLLHAWAGVQARSGIPARLLIFGDGPQMAELQKLTVQLGLTDTIEFRGFCADIPQSLAEADIFVLPSYAEGNSNSILEAMRAGLPVISTRIAGAPIQVGPAGEPWLFAPGDHETLSRHLLALIENSVLRRELGRQMRQRVESLFAMDRIAATYEKAYRLLAAGRQDAVGQLNPGLFECTPPPKMSKRSPDGAARNPGR